MFSKFYIASAGTIYCNIEALDVYSIQLRECREAYYLIKYLKAVLLKSCYCNVVLIKANVETSNPTQVYNCAHFHRERRALKIKHLKVFILLHTF